MSVEKPPINTSAPHRHQPKRLFYNWKSDAEVRQAGRDAHRRGLPIWANPATGETSRLWFEGWREAEKETHS